MLAAALIILHSVSAMSDKRAAAAAYLAEHRLEAVLSSALNAVARLGPNDLVLALAISLRRHAQTAKSHAEVESAVSRKCGIIS